MIPDRDDPHYGQYEDHRESRIQASLASGIDYAVARGAKVISMSIGYSAPSGIVTRVLQRAYDHGVVVVASAVGNSGAPGGDQRRQSGAGILPRRLSRRDQRGRRRLGRGGGRLLQR